MTAATAAVIATYALFNPMNEPMAPKCIVKTLTGLSCPGCGTQRTLHAIAIGRPLNEALSHNLFIIPATALLATLAAAYAIAPANKRPLRLVTSNATLYTLLATIALWTIARNIYGL